MMFLSCLHELFTGEHEEFGKLLVKNIFISASVFTSCIGNLNVSPSTTSLDERCGKYVGHDNEFT